MYFLYNLFGYLKLLKQKFILNTTTTTTAIPCLSETLDIVEKSSTSWKYQALFPYDCI